MRYKDVYWRLLSFLVWTETLEKDELAYEFTIKQVKLFDDLEEAVERWLESPIANDRVTLDRLSLDFMVYMLDHQFKVFEYESGIISGLVMMVVCEDGGWELAENYTLLYSAVITVGCVLVVYQSLLERQDEVKKLRRTMNEDDVEEAATSLYQIVKKKVRRFMVVASKDTKPGLIDWIFDTRLYSLQIRYIITAAPTVDWQGDRVSYQQIRFIISSLSDMLHILVSKERVVLGELLMVKDDPDLLTLPLIYWDRLEDNHSEDRVGYSFMHDHRNVWLVEGKDWVVKQIVWQLDKRLVWMR